MADYQVHISQAEHNEETANMLVHNPPHHDWGITAAFYAAIHYVESWLFNNKNGTKKHSETSVPLYNNGTRMYSFHTWRERLVKNNFGKNAWKSYMMLRNESNNARYLINTGMPAPKYYSPKDAEDMILKDLAILKQEVGV